MINGYEYMVAQLIKQRHKLEWSQEDLAHKIGCTKSLVHKWEQYKRVPSGFMLSCWVEALGLQITVTKKQEDTRQSGQTCNL